MGDLFERLRVPSIAVLKQLSTGSAPVNAPALRNKRWYPVEDGSAASDGSGTPVWYQYRTDDARPENLPTIVEHPSGGAFELSGGAAASGGGVTEIVEETPYATRVPSIVGEELLQTDATYGSYTTWRAMGVTNTSWVVIAGTPMIEGPGDSFNPDGDVVALYPGQEFVVILDDGYGNFSVQKYIAVARGSSEWMPL